MDDLAGAVESCLWDFADESELNVISETLALELHAVGVRLYDRPLVKFGSAHDQLFCAFRKPEAIGPAHGLPGDWLEGAETVISYFFPASARVRESNRAWNQASVEWFHARIDGQRFILEAGRHLVEMLEGLGYRAVRPAGSEGFEAVFIDEDDRAGSFRSNWSERHVAYACGLGTFSLSKGVITEAGVAGRFGSVVTSAKIPATPRPYSDLYEYCIMCGACARRCPPNAISLETGKDHFGCYDELMASKKRYPGYYGCGKCQVGVPCEFERPKRAVES